MERSVIGTKSDMRAEIVERKRDSVYPWSRITLSAAFV